MPSNRSTKANRASAADPTALRARTQTPRSPATDSVSSTDEAAGRPAQSDAIERAMARQNVRLTTPPGAIGPIGRTVLLIALLALVGLIAVWMVLAL